jgi:hypothetical protein
MNDHEFLLARYSSLIDLWSHHNAMQLQWPAVVISATLVVISIVIPSQLSTITNTSLWGHDVSLTLSSGIPLLLSGLGIATVLYMMGRGQEIMGMLETEINLTEGELGKVQQTFKQLNHPKGLSARKLIRFYMIFLLALPTMFFGMCFTLGLLWGAIGTVSISLAWFILEQHNWISHKRLLVKQQ